MSVVVPFPGEIRLTLEADIVHTLKRVAKETGRTPEHVLSWCIAEGMSGLAGDKTLIDG